MTRGEEGTVHCQTKEMQNRDFKIRLETYEVTESNHLVIFLTDIFGIVHCTCFLQPHFRTWFPSSGGQGLRLAQPRGSIIPQFTLSLEERSRTSLKKRYVLTIDSVQNSSQNVQYNSLSGMFILNHNNLFINDAFCLDSFHHI